MDSEPLPDHYRALGVDPKAEVIAIKVAYRKLVLTCHPDKVTDPALKQQKQEDFHRIQKAYEVLSDEKERGKYDAEVTLEAFRKTKISRDGPSSSSREKSTRFDARATTSPSARYATEERRPSGTYDDDKYYDDRDRDRARGSTRTKYDTSRKYDTYDAYPKPGSSPRADKESSRSAKASTERARSERTKARDKEERRERSDRSRFMTAESESSADEKARHEAGYKRRSQEDEAQRQAADARRKAEERRSYDDGRYSTERARKLSTQEEEARLYQHKSRAQVEAEIRPSPVRTSSRDYYGDSSRPSRREARPEAVRRSSAQPKDRRGSSGRERDRAIPEIVEWGGEDSSSRRPPTLKPYNSSPATIEVPRAMPQRGYSESSRDHRTSTSPPPFHRSQTMPTNTHSSSRSKPVVSRQSTLRETMTPEHPHAHPGDFPTIPLPHSSSVPKRTVYHYNTPGGPGVSLRPEDLLAGSHRTILREPERQRHRSPSPLSRPPMGANRPSEQPIPKIVPMPMPGRTSRNVSPTNHHSSRPPLYGEIPSANYGRPRAARQGSYGAGEVHYAKAYGPEDVRWAPRGRENERGDFSAPKPGLNRHATMAY